MQAPLKFRPGAKSSDKLSRETKTYPYDVLISHTRYLD